MANIIQDQLAHITIPLPTKPVTRPTNPITSYEEPSPSKQLRRSIAIGSGKDNWSQRGLSSAVSINVVSAENSLGYVIDTDDYDGSSCCVKTMFGNCVLPAVFGVNKYRNIRKHHWKDYLSQQLLGNALYFCTKINLFTRSRIPEVGELASQLYFPVGQIEADGLSVISAEIWAATYLSLQIHTLYREADFENVRNAYTNLVWESGKAYKVAETFSKILQTFRSKIVPLWNEVEAQVSLCTGDFAEIDNPTWETRDHTLLTVQLHEDLVLKNSLSLTLIPEKNPNEVKETHYSQISYGEQIDIILALLEKPVKSLQACSKILSEQGTALVGEQLCPEIRPPNLDHNLTCTKAIKILLATLKILNEEVRLPSGIKYDVKEWIRFASDSFNTYISYVEWIANKLSEFHSMLRLCYNFAALCFDLDLPRFDEVIEKQVSALQSVKNNGSDDDMIKNASLTKIMVEAKTSSLMPGKSSVVDDEFDWQDFYKTNYHGMLQKLPLRVGPTLLHFHPKTDAKISMRQRVTSSQSIVSYTVSRILGNEPGNFFNAYRSKYPL